MTTKKPTKPDTIASLAKAAIKEAEAAGPEITAAYAAALAAKNAAQEALSAAEVALDIARRAKAQHERRAEAAAALARLADRPDLIDVLMDGRKPTDGEITALIRRGLMSVAKGGYCRPTSYHWTNLGYRVADLARELRDRLAAPE